jgi:hypothetical protein
MSPKAVLWIRQNKGKAEKHIVLSECVIRLPQDSIEEGFFLNLLCRPAFKTELNRSGTKPQFQHDIELSIVKAAIDLYQMSSAVLYNGRPVKEVFTGLEELNESRVSNENAYGFVYFIRNGDLFKIGITENLLRRLGELQPDEVLNVIRCKNYQEVEKRLHLEFKQIRLPQTEYFRMEQAHVLEAHRLLHSYAAL